MPDEPNTPTPEPQPAPPPPAASTTTGTVTVAGMVPEAVAKQQAAAARKEATDKVIADLGCSPSEAKAIIDQVRAAGEAQKSDAQKALDSATRKMAEADQLVASVKAERLSLKVERALHGAGVPDAAIADVARIVAVDVDADDDAIKTAVDGLKTRLPALFTPAPAGAPTPPGINPPKPPGTPGALTGIEAGAARAKAERESQAMPDPFSVFKPAGL